ncbi:PEPxxWA-CTERM sorting domain-containing protein [Sphingomonas sp. PAMC 26621]|uniref:PEPxxWA-CTERM sorting domain-containing protein n=1 Tax=Sphingomonas sp. PAMC 26621 TaxID=1112213 RepID=UPI0004748AB2|nr:PEPxxWA-CTERM sorting domain-containing protein [Sphingomonas sp. PAMC 26621]
MTVLKKIELLAATRVSRGLLSVKAAGALALVLGTMAAGSASAAVIVVAPNAPLTGSGYTITLGNGIAGFTFTMADTGYGPGAAVSTSGNGEVSTFLGGVADFEAGSSIDQNGLYSFAAYPVTMPGVIPYSAADDFIGLAYSQADGVHYGYAEVNGSQLISYGYQTLANTSIRTGMAPVAAVPEVGTWAMMILGMGAIGFAMRRQRVAMRVTYAA